MENICSLTVLSRTKPAAGDEAAADVLERTLELG
jgi:hypothetical protein